jgi:S-adenosylmethionine-diacylgycerolhomoserine-N-methlytransferase
MSAYSSDSGANIAWLAEATDRMNRMYRRQRHIYNGTRRYYLLGRDRMIAKLQPAAGASVLEIGCGTGRNLILAARRHPDARFFGIDVSTHMLTSAISAISRRGLTGRIRVAHGDGTAFDPKVLLGTPAFDEVMISYSLSMIPDWSRVLEAAFRHLKPGGRCTSSISAASSDCRELSARCCCDGLRCSTSRRATISSACCQRWRKTPAPA